ncbi:hypothetical protein SDC9_195236 [bioreactor metagenome]|uniref:Uncharacterized protein n=1 Tax=bioreactor metagenome TaxID=1076179 RepID=A0A645IJY7_9ZZZZ
MGDLHDYAQILIFINGVHRPAPYGIYLAAFSSGNVDAIVGHPLVQRGGIDQLLRRKPPLERALHRGAALFPARLFGGRRGLGGSGSRWGRGDGRHGAERRGSAGGLGQALVLRGGNLGGRRRGLGGFVLLGRIGKVGCPAYHQ